MFEVGNVDEALQLAASWENEAEYQRKLSEEARGREKLRLADALRRGEEECERRAQQYFSRALELDQVKE